MIKDIKDLSRLDNETPLSPEVWAEVKVKWREYLTPHSIEERDINARLTFGEYLQANAPALYARVIAERDLL